MFITKAAIFFKFHTRCMFPFVFSSRVISIFTFRTF